MPKRPISAGGGERDESGSDIDLGSGFLGFAVFMLCSDGRHSIIGIAILFHISSKSEVEGGDQMMDSVGARSGMANE
jgi:hypothetical protein